METLKQQTDKEFNELFSKKGINRPNFTATYSEVKALFDSLLDKAYTEGKKARGEEILKWAESTVGATGVDMQSRRWIELEYLLKFLNQ